MLDPNNDEVACGVLAVGKAGAQANATAYVTPGADGASATYAVRVAQVTLQSPNAGLPMLTVRFAGRDVTPPHIVVDLPGKAQPQDADHLQRRELVRRCLGNRSGDRALGVPGADQRQERRQEARGLRVTYTWRSTGARPVNFVVKDRAGNESMYRFTTFVLDTIPPDVSFSLRPPVPGAHRLQVVVKASESVHLRLLVTEAGRRRALLRRTVDFWGDASHSRSISLTGGVGQGLLVIGGIARDLAGNATPLPQCLIDPVTGQGNCAAP